LSNQLSATWDAVPPARGYLEALRALSTKDEALLIFDEVMTGFRCGFPAEPRSCTAFSLTSPPWERSSAAGYRVGAYGGPSEIMDLVAPLGPMYQAGTLSGNPLAMAAGYATLYYLRETPGNLRKAG